MQYHAPCFDSPALTMLLMPISLSTRNVLSNPSHSATYTIQMPMDGVSSPMSRGRVAFIGVSVRSWSSTATCGFIEVIGADTVQNVTLFPFNDISKPELARLENCYTHYHPDAKMWLPYQPRHPFDSSWARFEPQDIYYVGGFGE